MKIIFSIIKWLLCVTLVSGKKELSLNERVEKLTSDSLSRPLLRFNGEKFRQFVQSGPRNYSVVVMFIALSPSRNCEICGYANDEFTLVANSWRYSAFFSNRLYFALVDFDEAPEVFQSLNLNSAPYFMHFPAKGKPKKADTLDILRVGFAAENVAKWLAERTDLPPIRIFRPPNYSGLLGILTLLTLVVGFLYFRKNSLDFVYNSTIWGLGALGFVFVMISGQMWNHIRGPPFIQKAQSGSFAYIHGSSQGQFVLETYIIALLYAATTLGMVLMKEATGKKEEIRKNRLQAVIGLALLSFFFSLQISIFRAKAQGYPYSFLLK